MKVLVTGALGNVGKYVIRELLNMGEQVVAADIDIYKMIELYGNEVDIVEFDFTNPDTFQSALKDVDRVFLMRPPHLGKPEDLFPFIDSLKANNMKLVSFLSLMGVEKNTIPPHHKIEKYIESIGIPYAHVRPGFFMQNLSGIHSVEIRENDEIFIPAGKSKTSFIDAADIGLSFATILNNADRFKNTSHTITGPESLDYYQVADILSNTTGRKINYRKPGYLEYRRHYINKRGLDRAYVNVTIALYFMTRMGTAKLVTDEFKKLTGRNPRTFKQFVEANLDSFI